MMQRLRIWWYEWRVRWHMWRRRLPRAAAEDLIEGADLGDHDI